MKIGIYMPWNAFSMCSKNHKVVTMFRYPKRLKTNKIWQVPKKRKVSVNLFPNVESWNSYSTLTNANGYSYSNFVTFGALWGVKLGGQDEKMLITNQNLNFGVGAFPTHEWRI